MTRRWNGGIIGPANTPTGSSASGVWDLLRAQVATGAGTWTGIPFTASAIVVAGGGGGGGSKQSPGGGGDRKSTRLNSSHT